MTLAPWAPAGKEVQGRIVGFVEAADGLVVVLHPEDTPPEIRTSVHYQHIVSITKGA
jgi:hypothetical protein